jgi:regulator of PEP synthase PpsR (kinase-PPPase family)
MQKYNLQNIIFETSLYEKVDLLLLLLLPSRGQKNPLSYYILYNESKHNNYPSCLGRQRPTIGSLKITKKINSNRQI